MHTFEEIRTRTPASPNEAAPEAVMLQAAWEALLQDAVQGLRPPYTHQTPLPVAPDHPPQGVGTRRPTEPPPPHQQHTRKGKGTGKGARKGPR